MFSSVEDGFRIPPDIRVIRSKVSKVFLGTSARYRNTFDEVYGGCPSYNYAKSQTLRRLSHMKTQGKRLRKRDEDFVIGYR